MKINLLNKKNSEQYHPNNNYKQKQITNKTCKPVFCAHPEFYSLSKKHNIVASSFFRRGPYYGSPCDDFKNIVELFSKVFKPQSKQKMLLAGIGSSQEPLSYLAVIKSLFEKAKITDKLELKTIDLQTKPTAKELFQRSFFEFNDEPVFARSSFIKDEKNHKKFDVIGGCYRVNNEIIKFLNNAYNKSLWETRLQDAIKTFKNEEFDLISANNIIGYIVNKNSRIETMENIHRTLKTGGTFITDTFDSFIIEANLANKFEEIYEGIYIKKS